MRFRLAVLVSVLIAVGGVTTPSLVSAAPRHNHHLTIAVSRNPILAGQGVVIYGQLKGVGNAGQVIRLYHHLADSGQGYSQVGTTITNASGFYEFIREEQVVETNRSWFVSGPVGTHSRTLHERVEALVSIAANPTSTDTNHNVVFSGQVTPNHAYERVYLQQQQGSGDDWHTLSSTQLGAGSQYTIAHRFRVPGIRDLRVLFRGDHRNIRGASDPVTVNIEQAQVPGFTIKSSQPISPAGSSVTISGVLDQPGTTTPEPSTPVQLWGRTADQRHYAVMANGTTGSDGSYSFNQSNLTTNTVYYVATVPSKGVKRRHTAVLFQGVQDVLTLQPAASVVAVGQTVTLTGSVTPVKPDHIVYLQVQGKDGDWHNVEVQVTQNDGTYQFTWTPGTPGTFMLRARMFHDENNVGAASQPPVTVTATLPPASSLPPGS
jgi:hypothetical protein